MDEQGEESLGEKETLRVPWMPEEARRLEEQAVREAAGEALSLGERVTVRPEWRTQEEWQGRRWKAGEEILGRYVVEGELGQGGMGVVYACLDKVGGVRVAVKALPPEVGRDRDEMEEVRENFRLVYGLSHPNIAGVRTLEKDGRGEYFLVMELAAGESLRRWMKRKRREGGLSAADAVPVLRQLASALDYAHGERVIHRDVKPGNAVIDEGGRVKVLDFGLAAQIRSSLSRVSRETGRTTGTRTYMAPEQWQGKGQDAKTDQYALAAMAYEMLAGRVPFEGDDPAVLREAVLYEEPEAIEGLPEGAMAALRKGLAKARGERFGSCGEFVEALEGKRTARPAEASREILTAGGKTEKGEEIFLLKVRLGKALEAAGREDATPEERSQLGEIRERFLAGEEALKAGDKGAAGSLFGQAEEWLAEWQKALKARVERERREAEKRRAEKEAKRQAEEAKRLAEAKRRTEEEAKRLAEEDKRFEKERQRAGETKTIALPGGAEMEMVWCPPGRFRMGSPNGEEGRYDNETLHEVTLTEGFWLAKHPVTQKQWQSVMGNNPSWFKGWFNGNLPVEHVSWNDAQEFCQKAGLRLPTEAQWEYACRAGSTGPYVGNGCLGDMGWYEDNSGGKTHPVGTKQPNAWGLCDMHGNVWEWCADWYGAYPSGSVTNPAGPREDSDRVARGGSWGYGARDCRSACRHHSDPASRYSDLGLRVALLPVR
jgi:formylglycine-generating enzyme required for sulfatase activity